MAQNRMKQQTNQHQSERHIKEGDWVFLRLQPYKQSTLKQNKNRKLALKFIGLPRYFTRLKKVAYELDFPAGIHKFYHVYLVKRGLRQTMPLKIKIQKLEE